MALIAPVVNGEIQDVTSTSNSVSSKNKSNSSLDKDAFLQLLVAQMRYQDPLEPTSNTEFISQFATFSELEEMQNMRSSMDIQRAQALVGQEVIMRTTNETTGATSYKTGRVDYVEISNGKPFLVIDEGQYSLDDLDTVVDKQYKDAYDKAYALAGRLAALPKINLLTTASMKEVFNIKETYEAMNDYEKSFIAEDYVKMIDDYVAKMEELMKQEGLTYTKEEIPTTEGLLQDLLDKIDALLKDVGDISGSVSKEEKPDGDETGGTEDTGNTDDTSGTDDTGNVDGSGSTEEGGSSGGEQGGV